MTGFLLIALAVVALDRATKWLVIRNIPLGHEIPILGQWGQFTHIKNTGAAFGLFPGSVVPLVIVSLLASIIIVVLAERVSRQPGGDAAGRLVSLGLILGGAVGNLIDRIFLGKVTDFILVGIPDGARFPVFNVADSAVTIGVAVLAFGIYFSGHREPGPSAPADSERIDLTPDTRAPGAVTPPEPPVDAVPGDSR